MKKVIFIILALLMIVSTVCLSACTPTGCAPIDDMLGLKEENPYSQEQDLPKPETVKPGNSTFALKLERYHGFYLPFLSGMVKTEFAPLKLLLVFDGKQYDITNLITEKKFVEADNSYQTYFTGSIADKINHLSKKEYDISVLAVRGEKVADSGYIYKFNCDDEYFGYNAIDWTTNKQIIVFDKESNWTKWVEK